MALLQQLFPYLLPAVLVLLNEIIAHNPSLQSNSLIGLVVSTVVSAIKAAIGLNPPPAPKV